jgi:hypothetical protein
MRQHGCIDVSSEGSDTTQGLGVESANRKPEGRHFRTAAGISGVHSDAPERKGESSENEKVLEGHSVRDDCRDY